ncbi:MAG: hypothetical protein Q9186_005024 [Xanthomendoza sp. 1 TL-2023]
MSSKIPIRFLDAGLGTTLESPPHNAKFQANSSLWSSDFLITSPSTLSGVHKAFVEAGADVLLTATYQASLEGFAATKKKLPAASTGEDKQENAGTADKEEAATYSSKEEASRLMRSAVPLARQAFSAARGSDDTKSNKRKEQVALSLGAYGATMKPSTEYSGEYKPEKMQTVEGLADWHEERLLLFKDDETTWNDIDNISFETIPVLQEVQAVRQVMAKHNSSEPSKKKKKKEWWISCVFPNDDLTLPDGNPVSAVVAAMLQTTTGENNGGQRPWGIGINCTDIRKLNQLILQYETAAQQYILDDDDDDNNNNNNNNNKNTNPTPPSSTTPKKTQHRPWLILYPDGAQGSIYDTNTQQWEIDPQIKAKAKGPQQQRPWHEEFADIITKIAERGCCCWKGVVVGGCCKTTADDIRKLRERLASLREAEGCFFFLETG